ncbi:Uncharacterized protein FWK35_00028327 [Aphis craccivora]|uniref:Uncharacterized protein n=1 Tax=Aphis craccivora TaxID=307492 RepID=A0A6G0WY11_APHCR|nr:Uncharacterized protein FWK35_00028327 [Aphis craccivora]
MNNLLLKLSGTSHRFPNPPKNLLMFKKWMEVIGNDDFKDMESSVINEKHRVCSNHFSQDNFSPAHRVSVEFIHSTTWKLGFQNIFKTLNDNNIKVLLPRHLNQDALENLFGAIRALGYRNNNPTCEMFSSAYKTLLLNNLMSAHSPGSNCEKDFSGGCLTSYQTLFETYTNCEANTIEREIEERVADGLPKKFVDNDYNLKLLGNQTQNYIAVYIVKKLNFVLFKNCRICLNEICSKGSNDHKLIQARDYKHNSKYLLKYPNSNFCMLVYKLFSKKKNSLKICKFVVCKYSHLRRTESPLEQRLTVDGRRTTTCSAGGPPNNNSPAGVTT